MADFTIEPVGGTGPTSCVVYDNGKQQCHLLVSVDFQDLLNRPLTDAEKNTIKVVEYSNSTDYGDLDLPTGMTSSRESNEFLPHPDNVSRASGASTTTEPFDFYISSSTAPGSRKLMAVIRVFNDALGREEVYTTHYYDSNEGTSFESSVTVTTAQSWVVTANELLPIPTADNETRNTTYYGPYVWQLPSPLTIRERAMKLDGSWNTSVDEYLFYRDRKDGGINEVHECSSTTETNGVYHFSDGRSISFNYTTTQFGAAWIYIKDASLSSSLATFDEQQEIRMLDCYGTYQIFTLDGHGGGINIR